MITPLFLTSIVLYLGNFPCYKMERERGKVNEPISPVTTKKAAASNAMSLWGGNLPDSCVTDQS